MSSSDPWLKWTWDVFSAQGLGAKYEKPADPAIGHFTLSAATDPNTQLPCYVVSPVGLSMPACWSKVPVYFIPKGKKPPTQCVKDLPPWSTAPSIDKQWKDGADKLRDQFISDVQHLEGAMSPEGKAETMLLFCLENATMDGGPLLAMHLSINGPNPGPREDGTAHGGGHE
jgi:hypothetical protein